MRVIILLITLLTPAILVSQSCKKRYKNKLEPNSKLYSCEANYTIEILKNDGKVIYKMYFPPTKAITKIVTFKDLKSKIKEGLYQENWDDGTIVNCGNFKNNLKEGRWIENIYHSGNYKNDLKEGEWLIFSEDSILYRKKNYLNGLLHGIETVFDSLGNKTFEQEYQSGKLISNEPDTSYKIVDVMPRFPGCADQNLSNDELQKCSKNKLSEWLVKEIKYPNYERENGIQGIAKISFVVDKNGNLKKFKILNGLSHNISRQLFKIYENMPSWIPGEHNGKSVPVNITLPIPFKLN